MSVGISGATVTIVAIAFGLFSAVVGILFALLVINRAQQKMSTSEFSSKTLFVLMYTAMLLMGLGGYGLLLDTSSGESGIVKILEAIRVFFEESLTIFSASLVVGVFLYVLAMYLYIRHHLKRKM